MRSSISCRTLSDTGKAHRTETHEPVPDGQIGGFPANREA